MSDKWGRRLFKTGSVWLLLMGLVHSFSLIRKPAPMNDTEKQLLDLMNNYHFHVMGSMRSMWDFHQGFSIAFMFAALGFAVLDLVLTGERPELLKRVALVNVIWLAAMTANSLHYFFAAPSSFLIVGLLIFLAAWAKLPSQAAV
jgi:hypothetical protein